MELSHISREIIAQYQEVLHHKKPHVPLWLRRRLSKKDTELRQEAEG
jgi:hypothetical protein